MCLITKNKKQIAELDMIVYKLMYHSNTVDYASDTFDKSIWRHMTLEEQSRISSGELGTTNFVISEIRKFIYIQNVIYCSEFELIQYNPDSINHPAYDNDAYNNIDGSRLGEYKVATTGFHAFTSIQRIDNNKLEYDVISIVVAKFTIPKGSEYCLDDSGLIVSNKIIFNDIVIQDNS